MIDKPREKALHILCRVEEGSFADSLLDEARGQFAPRDRAFMLELVYGVLRQRSRLDWILDQISAQPVSRTDLRTRNILRLGAYQMLFLDKVPVSAAVNTAAELAKEHGKKSGYVNAVLRNLDRRRGDIRDDPDGDTVTRLSILYSHPAWLVKRWLGRFGADRAEELLRANNQPAPLIIRTNTLRTTRDGLMQSLEADGAKTLKTVCSDQGLEIVSSAGLHSLTAYEKGLFMVQDEAAQLVGMLLAPKPGETVLDAAAAPGGKATHLAELMDNRGSVVALDIDRARIGKVLENAERLGTSIIRAVQADAAGYREGSFDKVLIDAPCSGLGVLRRHPDGRWNKKEDTIHERSMLQLRILRNCAGLVKPGGALVYATCTTEPEENEEVVNKFLSASPDFALDDPRQFLPESARSLVGTDRFFRTFPNDLRIDGFFGARIMKKK